MRRAGSNAGFRNLTSPLAVLGYPWREMILEVATLNVRAGSGDAFEAAFGQAQAIIASMPGYVSHELRRCLEAKDKYLLLVQWRRLEDHTVGFRQSPEYQEWKRLLHHFYDPFPTVEHYEIVTGVDR
jgi:heme-degrading monooxygenase HmoA